jgi:hypothetical protein
MAVVNALGNRHYSEDNGEHRVLNSILTKLSLLLINSGSQRHLVHCCFCRDKTNAVAKLSEFCTQHTDRLK